jgi:ParB family transcriptional regulator, chromosome partitioning protein
MALGKGLGALITSTTGRRHSIKKGKLKNDDSSQEKLWSIPLSSIKPDPDQPRKNFKAKELEELADSIKEHGVLQPILVSEKADGGYEIVSGERRWRASQIAGITEIIAIVKKLPKQQKLEIALIENIQRENLDPIEEAFAYKRLIDEFSLTQQQVAEKVGKARSTVANMIRLLNLPEQIKESLMENKINLGQAKILSGLKTEADQLDMLSSMLGKKITVRELEKAVVNKKVLTKGPKRRDPNITYLEDQLRQALGTKVFITEKNGKGKIMIDYYSKEELTGLVDKLNS